MTNKPQVLKDLEKIMQDDVEFAYSAMKNMITGVSAKFPAMGYYKIIDIETHARADRDEDDFIANAFWKEKEENNFTDFKVKARLNPLANKASRSPNKREIFTGWSRFEICNINNFDKLKDKLIKIEDIKLIDSSYSVIWKIIE